MAAIDVIELLGGTLASAADGDAKRVAAQRLALLLTMVSLLGIVVIATVAVWIAVRRSGRRRDGRKRPTNRTQLHPERDAWSESARRTFPEPPPREQKRRRPMAGQEGRDPDETDVEGFEPPDFDSFDPEEDDDDWRGRRGS